MLAYLLFDLKHDAAGKLPWTFIFFSLLANADLGLGEIKALGVKDKALERPATMNRQPWASLL